MKFGYTIAACSTAFPAAIAVIRLSGEDAGRLLDKCFVCKEKREHKRLRVGRLEIDGIMDTATAVYFSAPQSYTGEDMAEISIHGSAALAQKLLQFLIKNGARAADKGEFTKRAFLNGKMDLTSAEGVFDLINAESEGELRAAYHEMQGGIRQQIETIQGRLQTALAETDAAIDFPEEVTDSRARDGVLKEVRQIKESINGLINSYQSGRLIKNGVKIAVIGGVNVGKSSLVNALLKKERAIVTDIPGTTRDTLEDRYEHNGYKFVITDTAGLRDSEDRIERLGMERSVAAVNESDIILAVSEAGKGLEARAAELLKSITTDIENNTDKTNNITAKTGIKNNTDITSNITPKTGIKNTGGIKEYITPKKIIYIENKTDIFTAENAGSVKISAKTGENIESLKDIIFKESGVNQGGGTVITNIRHYESLKLALDILESIEEAGEVPAECIAADLMSAYNQIGRITGVAGSDDIIGRIFSDFCVGK